MLALGREALGAPFDPFRVACSDACEEVKSSKTGLSQLHFSLRESDGVKSIQIYNQKPCTMAARL